MKRIAVLIFVLISMILCVSCDISNSSEVDRIVVYTESVTTTETVGIDYIINRNTGKFHYPTVRVSIKWQNITKKSIPVTVTTSSHRGMSLANAVIRKYYTLFQWLMSRLKAQIRFGCKKAEWHFD